MSARPAVARLARAAAAVALSAGCAMAETNLAVDFAAPIGRIKALHGVNGGPFAYGENAKIEAYHTAAGFPHTRLHDVHWPYPDAVDIHCVFPLFHADPDDAKSYTFAKTDAYLAAIVRNKSQVVYRLGESIEPWTQFHNHPPKDFAKWAQVCVNIIRHYNDGWANGFRHGIKYWEIWNEPEAAFMWTGTREQYLQLYEVAAKAIKAHDPSLKVGGPAATNIGSELVKPFLGLCRDKQLPLDFFSWHAYEAAPQQLADGAKKARQLLDEHGFTKTELHLNEWRYHTTWNGLRPSDPKEYVNVPEWFARSSRAEGAAFCAAVLIRLQDAPVDVANYYSADTTPWSMFGSFGIPTKTFHVFRAFNGLAKLPTRVRCEGQPGDGIAVCAGLAEDKKSGALLISNFKSAAQKIVVTLKNAPWKGNARLETHVVDEMRDFERTSEGSAPATEPVRIEVTTNTVHLLHWRAE